MKAGRELEVAIALGHLAVREETLWYALDAIVPGSGHRDIEEGGAPLGSPPCYRGPRSDGMQPSHDVEYEDRLSIPGP